MFARLLNRLEHRPDPAQAMPGMDGVRALAVLLVVGFHLHAFAGSPRLHLFGVLDVTPWLANGYLGVQVFFVLSGFLLMLPWARAFYAGERSPPLRDYFRRRWLRIVPAYYVHLAVLFLVLVPAVHSYRFLSSSVGWLNLLAHLAFAQFLFPSAATGAGINGALWTLSIEAQFYLVLPWLSWLFLGPRLLLGLVGAVALSWAWTLASSGLLLNAVMPLVWQYQSVFFDPPTGLAVPFTPYLVQMFLANQFPAQLLYFALGMAAASLYAAMVHSRPRGVLDGPAGTVLGLAALLVLWWGAQLAVPAPEHAQGRVLAGIAAALLLLSACHRNFMARVLLGSASVRLIGVVSYSLYLWHVPVCFLVAHYLMPAQSHPAIAFLYMTVLGGGASLGVAWLSYRWVERPFLLRRQAARSVSRLGKAEQPSAATRPAVSLSMAMRGTEAPAALQVSTRS